MAYSKLLIAMVVLVFLAACGDTEDSGPSPEDAGDNMTNSDMGATDVATDECVCDSDCELGEVCSVDRKCVVAPCADCTEDQICYTTPENPEGSCSAGEDICPTGESCAFDTDCSLGAVCGAQDICVVASCSFCTEDQICYRASTDAEGSCSAPECAGEGDCEDGESCLDGICGS